MSKREPTPEECERLRELMSEGKGYKPSAAVMGLTDAMAKRWRRRGLRDLAAEKDTPFAAWATVMNACRAEIVSKAESFVHGAYTNDGLEEREKLSNARWILKNLAREEYGDNVEVRVRGEIESLCELCKPHMSASAYVEMIHALATVAGVDLGASEGDESEDDDALPLH